MHNHNEKIPSNENLSEKIQENVTLEKLKINALPLDELYVSGIDNTEGKLTDGEIKLAYPLNT